MSISSPSSLGSAKQQRFKDLMDRGKECVQNGEVREGLEAMKEALTICRTTKLLARIEKCEEYLKACEAEEEEEACGPNEKMIEVCKGFSLFHEIYYKLYPYQREGIAWMWGLYKRQKGGILGDDMGLGKTIQIIGFLSGMFQEDLVKHIIIIMPVSLLPNWKLEFSKWCPDLMLYVFHGGTKKERERNLYKVQRRGGILLTSYGLVVSNEESFTSFNGRSFVWDYVILDEGHKIKNPTKTTKAVHNLASKHRLVLTGTPIQNNLEELWALYDFAHQGTLLGSRQTFKMQYENPITHARAKNATIGERKLGTEIAHNLRKLIEPYFLRRTKEEVLKNSENKENVDSSEIDALSDKMRNMKLSTLSRKNDLIVWTFLSDVQYKIYTGFLESEAVKNILMTKKSPLVQLTVLKKICDHPRLLSNKSGFKFLLNDDICEEDVEKEFEKEEAETVSIDDVSDEDLIAESGKMRVLIQLLENLKLEGHRTLVFSLSRKILDIIQKVLVNRSWKVLRLDGTITKIEERARRVNVFQNDSSYPILLLTTQVGGVGLTLTAADRVVIYDPSWNPSTDAQAVDRVYRIGQSRNVVVYRFITCGTVEEKIYRRQVFKDSIIRQATGDTKDPYRYFTHQELYELFTVDNVRYSTTQVQLAEMHSQQRKTDTSLDEHIAFLHSLDIFGISDHDLMFSGNMKDETEDNDVNVVCEDYIKKRVEKAQQLVQIEADIAQEDLLRTGTYSRPYSVSGPPRKPSEKVTSSSPTINKDLIFKAYGDLGNEANMLSSEDEMSISAQSPIKADKSSPSAPRSNDKYELPFVIETATPLKEKKFQSCEDENADVFEIDDDVLQKTHTSTPIDKSTMQIDEVIDIVSPGPFRSSLRGENYLSPVRSPRISDFDCNTGKQLQSTVAQLGKTNANSSQANLEKSMLFLTGNGNVIRSNEDCASSADNSVEVLVSDTSDEEEFKTPLMPNKTSSADMSHRLYSSPLPEKFKSLHVATTPGSCTVIEDSLTSENNSNVFELDAVRASLCDTKPRSFAEWKPKEVEDSPRIPDGLDPVHKSLTKDRRMPRDRLVREAKPLVFSEPKLKKSENSLRVQHDRDPLHKSLTEERRVPNGTFRLPRSSIVNTSSKSEQKGLDNLCSLPGATDNNTGLSKLWRFEQMHEALSRNCDTAKSPKEKLATPDKKCVSSGSKHLESGHLELKAASPVLKKDTSFSPSPLKKSDLLDSGKKCKSLSRKSDLEIKPFYKVSTSQKDVKVEKSEFEDVPEGKVSTPHFLTTEPKQECNENCASGDVYPDKQTENLPYYGYGSPRRITALKVAAKTGTPVKLNSFALAVASAAELSNPASPVYPSEPTGGRSVTPGNKSGPNETPKSVTPRNRSRPGETPKSVTPSNQSKPGDTPKSVTPGNQSRPGDTPKSVTPRNQSRPGDTPKSVTPRNQLRPGDTPKSMTPSNQSRPGDTPKSMTPGNQSRPGDTPKSVTPGNQSRPGDTPKSMTPSNQSRPGDTPKSMTPSNQSRPGDTPKSMTPCSKSKLRESSGAVPLVFLSDSDAHDLADDSPIVMAKKKYSRKVIDSDSDADEAEEEDLAESEHSSGSEDSEAGSLKDFITSDTDVDDEQSSSSSADEETDSEDEPVKHKKSKKILSDSEYSEEYSDSSGSETK